MKKKLGGFYKYVDDAFKYLKDSANYIWFAVGVFIVSGFIGFFFADKFTFIEELLRNLIAQTEGLGAFELMVFILQNNASSAFFAIVLGFALGVFPLINAISNGIILGFVLNMSYKLAGFSEFWRLLPHGIFELPAIFIALGLGIRLGMFIFSKSKSKSKELGKRFLNSLLVYFLIVLPLLIIAAIIEGLLIAFVS